jgi:hypothetical protein
MTTLDMKWARELRNAGSALGRAGLSVAVVEAVNQFDGTYKGAMILAGRLQAVAQAAKADSYWTEKVQDGFQKQKDILQRKSGAA